MTIQTVELEREQAKSMAIYSRLRETTGAIKARKARIEELTSALAAAELAAGGRQSPESDRIRKELATTAAEEEDLARLEMALLEAASRQRQAVDAAREIVNRRLAEAAFPEWVALLREVQAYVASPGAQALNALLATAWRSRNVDGIARDKLGWLPLPTELQRMESLTAEAAELWRADGLGV